MMLSLSMTRPVVFSPFLPKPWPKPRLLPLLAHLSSSASASAVTPPNPRSPTSPDVPGDPDPTPLFPHQLAHPVPAASLAAFCQRASALVPPSAPHLHYHLRWLLADLPSVSPDTGVLLFRAPLEALWLRHVRDRRPFQYVVGNEHWRDLVVEVREGVLIPRFETEAVVEMVGSVEGSEDGWWADLGIGSGAIAVAVARMLGPRGKVFATDVNDVAIEVARFNVERHGVHGVTLPTEPQSPARRRRTPQPRRRRRARGGGGGGASARAWEARRRRRRAVSWKVGWSEGEGEGDTWAPMIGGVFVAAETGQTDRNQEITRAVLFMVNGDQISSKRVK